MDLYLKTPTVSIYWLKDVSAGYGVWTGMLHLEPTKEALAKCEELLATHRSTRWISSTEEALVSALDTQEFISNWLERMGRSKKLRAWADIPPKSATARLVLKNLGVESSLHSIAFAQFPTLEEAKRWIRSK